MGQLQVRWIRVGSQVRHPRSLMIQSHHDPRSKRGEHKQQLGRESGPDENIANYLVELKVDVNKSKQIYSKYRFTQEQNNYAGNKLIQAFDKSDHVMHLFTRSQKDKPTLITLMTVIAMTHFPKDAEHKTKLRNKFNEFPSCKDKSKLLGQFNSWCDLFDELEHMYESNDS